MSWSTNYGGSNLEEGQTSLSLLHVTVLVHLVVLITSTHYSSIYLNPRVNNVSLVHDNCQRCTNRWRKAYYYTRERESVDLGDDLAAAWASVGRRVWRRI